MSAAASTSGHNFEIPGIGTLSYWDAYVPAVVSNAFGCYLLGVVVMMTYIYFSLRRKDPIFVKVVIALLLLLSYAAAAVASQQVIEMLIQNPGDFAHVVSPHKRSALISLPVIAWTQAVIVQGMMAWKILVLARSLSVSHSRTWMRVWQAYSAVLALGVTTDAVLTILLPISSLRVKDESNAFYSKASREYFRLGSAQAGTFLATDILLAAGMTIQLGCARSGFEQTNKIINSTITTSVQSGIVVTICQLISMILWHKRENWVVFFWACIGHIYALTLLAIYICPKIATRSYTDSTMPGPSLITDSDAEKATSGLGMITNTLTDRTAATSSLRTAQTSVSVRQRCDCQQNQSQGSYARLSPILAVDQLPELTDLSRTGESPTSEDLVDFRAALMSLEKSAPAPPKAL